MRLLSIDPGPELSAWLLYDTEERRPLVWLKAQNDDVLTTLDECDADELAIEMIQSLGMVVGQETFGTVLWVGRFYERWLLMARNEPRLIYRRDVKLHLCADSRAKDANVRQALIDRYGGKEAAIGRKANPGPLYGVSGDVWSALAVAITAHETEAK